MIEQKLSQLKYFIQQYKTVLVAFSGGADSAFVLKVTRDVLGKENVLAVTGHSPSLPEREKVSAIEQAKRIDATHLIVDTEELGNENYSSNPSNRCFFCKTELYTKLSQLKSEKNFDVIFDGTNLDDEKDFRPGKIAAKENGIISPLSECGFTKDEIRLASKTLNLETWDKPASPCLSSRIPYGKIVTVEKLSQIERAENFLHELGFTICRVRHHDTIARIEVPSEKIYLLMNDEIRESIVKELKRIGFLFVTIDLNGFVSGNLNSTLQHSITPSLQDS
ncbi:MAG: ATP-dependent sacrificial sulfur transferase LarE [Ignavibacteriales bacterium]|nr:ATP-dependent sacrificial sulfur transferase LarE [Ignavibacteriales bacterium]